MAIALLIFFITRFKVINFKTIIFGRVHRRVHQEEKPHKCDVVGCDKAFKTPAELSRHAFRHTGEKPHKCDQCDKAFIRYDDLKRHYRIHTGRYLHDSHVIVQFVGLDIKHDVRFMLMSV